MKKLNSLFFGAALLAAGSVWAAPLTMFVHNYSNGVGQVGPGGIDALSDGYVTVSDAHRPVDRFSDSFGFGSLPFSTVDSFDLTLTFSGLNPFLFLEAWLPAQAARPTNSIPSV